MRPLRLLDLPADALLALLSFFTLRARLRTLSLVCKRLAALVPISIRRLDARPLASLCRLRPALLAQCVNLRELSVFCNSTNDGFTKCHLNEPLLALLATRVHSLHLTPASTDCKTEAGALPFFARLTSLSIVALCLDPVLTSLIALNSGALTCLSFMDPRPTDNTNCNTLFASLPPMPALRKFALICPVAPTTPLLARLSSLTKLKVDFFDTDGASLHSVVLPHLRALTLWETSQVSVASCAAWLRSLPALRSLKLYSNTSDASLLSFIASVTILSIQKCADCRALITPLLPHTNLRTLGLDTNDADGFCALTAAIGSRLTDLRGSLRNNAPLVPHLPTVFANCSNLTSLLLNVSSHDTLLQFHNLLLRLRGN